MNMVDRLHQKLNKFVSTKEFLFLCTLFIAALLLRAVNMDWGLPGQVYRHSAYVADEIGILYASMLIGRGGYLMDILQNYPFFYYLSFLVLSGYYGLGLLTGSFADLSDFHAQYIIDPGHFILVGRYFILVAASLTVPVTYLVARRLFNQRTAFFASIFILFSLGHVMYSQIFRLDSFLPLLFLLTFWAIVAAWESPANRLQPFVVCAILLACTLGTKVTAWAMIVPFLLLPFLIQARLGLGWPRVDRRFIFAFYLVVALYIVQIAPALPELFDILSGISTRLDKSGSFGNPADSSPYRYSIIWYLFRILPQQIGVPVYMLAIGGLALMLRDEARRPIIWLFYALLFAYLLPVGYATRTSWRDMLPLLPFLAIAAGYGLDWLLQKMITWQPVIVQRLTRPGFMTAVLLLILIWPVTATIQNKYLLLQDDTREIATAWIEANIPAGSNIAVQSYGPAILDAGEQEEIRRQVLALNKQPPALEQPTYHIFGLNWELAEARSLLLPDELIPFLLENRIKYVVVSSGFYARFYNEAVDLHFEEQGSRGRKFHDLIATNLELVEVFIPNWHNRPGPVIQIYQVPDNLVENAGLIPDSFDPYLGLSPPASAVGYYQTSPH
jgi:hypothetical protein